MSSAGKATIMAAYLLLSVGPPAAAQSVEVSSWVGFVVPVRDLGPSGVGSPFSLRESLEPSVAAGASVGIGVWHDLLAEAQLLYAPTDIEFRASPTEPNDVRSTKDARLFSATVGLQWRVPWSSSAWHPYLSAGVGLTRLEGPALEISREVNSTTDATWTVGGGTYWKLGSAIALRFEARTWTFRPSVRGDIDLQTNLSFLGGLTFVIR